MKNYLIKKYFIPGILIRKATGNSLIDYGHLIILPYRENPVFEEKKMISNNKDIQNIPKKIFQANILIFYLLMLILAI